MTTPPGGKHTVGDANVSGTLNTRRSLARLFDNNVHTERHEAPLSSPLCGSLAEHRTLWRYLQLGVPLGRRSNIAEHQPTLRRLTWVLIMQRKLSIAFVKNIRGAMRLPRVSQQSNPDTSISPCLTSTYTRLLHTFVCPSSRTGFQPPSLVSSRSHATSSFTCISCAATPRESRRLVVSRDCALDSSSSIPVSEHQMRREKRDYRLQPVKSQPHAFMIPTQGTYFGCVEKTHAVYIARGIPSPRRPGQPQPTFPLLPPLLFPPFPTEPGCCC